jgi:hypothetical protein
MVQRCRRVTGRQINKYNFIKIALIIFVIFIVCSILAIE